MYKDRMVVGICTADLDQHFHIKLVERVIRELNNLGCYVMVFGADSDLFHKTSSDLADACVFDLMNLERLDAVLLFSETIRQADVLTDLAKKINMAGVPVVSIGTEMEDCYNVIYDTDTAFEKMVRHIIEYHNVREVNFISGIKGNDVAERRLEIYQEVLEDNNILYEEERVGYGDFWFGPTRMVMDKFITPNTVPPEAIICANDSMAITVCDYLREKHIKVPEDIIVAGFDGIEEGVRHTPNITTCSRNEFHDAKVIANLTVSLCRGEQADVTTVLEYHLQLAQSCGCQEVKLFDPDVVIYNLSRNVDAYRSDVRQFAEMSDEFLQCRDENQFWELVGKHLPENSFLCVNSDLLTKGKEEPAERVNGFTKELKSMVNIHGNITRSDCHLDKVVPEAGKEFAYDVPVLILPLHFCAHIVGYIGVWTEIDREVLLGRWIHFLLNLDHSAGLRLVEGWKTD